MRRRPVKVNSRFYVFIAILVIVIAGVAVLILTGDKSGEIELGSLRLDLPVNAVIIRDEECVSADKYDRVQYNVYEGEEVFEGTPIATVYKWGYSDERMQSLLAVQSQILAAQLAQLSGVENADLELIQLQITQKQQAIRECVMSDSGKNLLVLERELDALLQQRIDYLKTTIQPTEELNSLYSSEEIKQVQLSEWNNDMISPGAGIVSFYFDGYEQALNYDKLDIISDVLVKKAQKNASGTYGGASDNLLYRLVNPNVWCVAFITSLDTPQRAVEGETYTVIFDGFADRPYIGTALEPIISEGAVVSIIKFEEAIDSLINIRSVGITLKTEAEGFKIPLAAIKAENGISYITIEGGESDYKVYVDVLSSDLENAIVRAINSTDTLYAGQRYLRP